jgi:hypothetical protein
MCYGSSTRGLTFLPSLALDSCIKNYQLSGLSPYFWRVTAPLLTEFVTLSKAPLHLSLADDGKPLLSNR